MWRDFLSTNVVLEKKWSWQEKCFTASSPSLSSTFSSISNDHLWQNVAADLRTRKTGRERSDEIKTCKSAKFFNLTPWLHFLRHFAEHRSWKCKNMKIEIQVWIELKINLRWKEYIHLDCWLVLNLYLEKLALKDKLVLEFLPT